MSDGCKCRPISVKQNLETEANVVVSECAARYRVVAYEVLRDYFVHFTSWRFYTQNIRL